MSRFRYSEPRVTSEPVKYAPPHTCGVCKEPTQVAMLCVREGGNEITGAPSDFLTKGELRPGVEFVTWITRCADHYLRDLYRTNRGRWSEFNNSGSPTLEDAQRFRAERVA